MTQTARTASSVDDMVPLAVLEATRGLLQVAAAADARQLAADLVVGLGGELVDSTRQGAHVIPADLSFGEGEPLLAAAPPGSTARALLERHLMPYLLDAQLVLHQSVRSERLAESASTDSLTGIPNRRMIDRALGRLTGGDTVIIVDLDHFKSVNDDFGHAAGDDVLRAFGLVLRETARGRDVVGRFGGEEFVAVLTAPGLGPDAFLHRLQTGWVDRRPRPVTFSAGIARSAGDPDETIRLADEALYRAKSDGRDRWVWATTPNPGPEPRPTDYLQPYLADAVLGKRRPAVRLTIDLLDNRMSPEAIVENLLVTAQREVGDRWQRNELTAADEHLASGVAAAALDALMEETDHPTSLGLTVVTCAEGDWHSLAAQMFGESLRSQGLGVKVLGASTPTHAVAEYLHRSRSDSLAISCSMATFFPGAVALANAAHDHGIPVIMGGRALGTDSQRAMRLGADAWAPSARAAAAVLSAWRARPPTVDHTAVELDPIGFRLLAEAERLGDAALPGLATRYPAMGHLDQSQVTSARQDLVLTVQFLGAAVLIDAPDVFTEYLTWLRDLMEHRGVPPQALLAGLDALHPLVLDVDRGAATTLSTGRALVGGHLIQ